MKHENILYLGNLILEIPRPGESRVHWVSNFIMFIPGMEEAEAAGSVFMGCGKPWLMRRVNMAQAWCEETCDSTPWEAGRISPHHMTLRDAPGGERYPFASKTVPNIPHITPLTWDERATLKVMDLARPKPESEWGRIEYNLRNKFHVEDIHEIPAIIAARREAWDKLRFAHLDALKKISENKVDVPGSLP